MMCGLTLSYSGGFTVRPRLKRSLGLVAIAAGVLSAIVCVSFFYDRHRAPLQRVPPPDPRVLVGGIVAASGVLLAITFLEFARAGRVRWVVTAAGIDVHRGADRETHIPWADVSKLDARAFAVGVEFTTPRGRDSVSIRWPDPADVSKLREWWEAFRRQGP